MNTIKHCISGGLGALVCAICACDIGTSPAAHIHEWKNWTVITAPACSTRGTEIRECAADLTHTEVRSVSEDPDAHSWGAWTVTIPAVCTETGIGDRTCTLCGKASVGDTIPAPGHDWEWLVTCEPDETNDGSETQRCKCAGMHSGETRPLYATGTAGLSFAPVNATAYSVAKGALSKGLINIPRYHRASAGDAYLPVTEIALSGFSTKDFTGFIIPDSISAIGDNAFQQCYALAEITVPGSVVSIGDYAFANCCKLASVTLPESLASIGNYAFNWCTALSGLTIPASVTTIGDRAFNGCFNLASVTFKAGSNITAFGSNAFPPTACANQLRDAYDAAKPCRDDVTFIRDGENWVKQP